MKLHVAPYLALVGASSVVSMLSGCSEPNTPHVQLAPDEVPMLMASRVRPNSTINTDALLCFNERIAQTNDQPINIAIGNIADYSGKVSDTEGAVITRGGAAMLYSALGMLRDSVILHERFDTSVTDLEMGYINSRQLGDGSTHVVDDAEVQWLPYFGGSIQKSDYTILGGITEVNFNIVSGGYALQINQVGPKMRTFVMNVAVDLRIVDTQSLVIKGTASFQKQFYGYEQGVEAFTFFDAAGSSQLFDFYAGKIEQEPMQLGVRAILEEASMDLVSQITDVDYKSCMSPPPISSGQAL